MGVVIWGLKSGLTRNKRGISVAEIVGDIFGALIPIVRVILNSHKIRKLSTVVDRLSTDTDGGFLMIDTEMLAIRHGYSQTFSRGPNLQCGFWPRAAPVGAGSVGEGVGLEQKNKL